MQHGLPRFVIPFTSITAIAIASEVLSGSLQPQLRCHVALAEEESTSPLEFYHRFSLKHRPVSLKHLCLELALADSFLTLSTFTPIDSFGIQEVSRHPSSLERLFLTKLVNPHNSN